MRRRIRALALLMVLSKLQAAPVGNPSLPFLLQEGLVIADTSWSSPQCGFIGDYLAQKKMRGCHSSKSLDIRKASLWGTSEIATTTWSIRERFNGQITLGSGQFSWQWQQAGQALKGRAEGGLVWGGDAKLIILGIRDTFFAVDAQAGGWDWMTGSFTLNGRGNKENAHTLLRYWQLGFALTQQISFFSPYLGCAVNHTRIKISHLSTGTGRMHARHEVGPFGGCSITSGNVFLLNLEWRGWFEEGLSLTAQIRF